MSYEITQVAGEKYADEIQKFNGLFPKDFLPLKPKHFSKGFWWMVHHEVKLIGFAGMVPFEPFPRVGYLKRAAIINDKEHRGNGLQRQLLEIREDAARSLTDWTHFITETHYTNVVSANNMIAAGFRLTEAERPWAKKTLFWIKNL
jgi:GNAT superfamily N-acetyltransferase